MAAASKIRAQTAEEVSRLPETVIVPLQAPFADERGEIQPLVDGMIESAVLISSKKGTVRANHYYKTDWHYCYVIKGRIEYHHRPHGSEAKPEMVMIEENQIFFTPPMVDHAMVFPEDTVFLTLGRNSRTQEVYEADVVRIRPIAG